MLACQKRLAISESGMWNENDPIDTKQIAVVSDDDYPFLSRIKWHAHEARTDRFYARGRCDGNRVYMHALISNEQVILKAKMLTIATEIRSTTAVATFGRQHTNRICGTCGECDDRKRGTWGSPE